MSRFPLAAISLLLAPCAHAATVIPINSFNPNTFFSGGVTGGIDFNDGTSSNYPDPNQPGFVDIPASNNKTYNVVTGGITVDITVTNANQANQNRNRNNAAAGRLVNDFEQWYGVFATSGNAVEATITLTGLVAETDYEISFFTFNVGSGQSTHSFYEGASSASPLITTFTTAGNQNDYSTWSPGITLGINSGASSTITVTVQAQEAFVAASNNWQSRLTLNGISIVQVPEPSVFALASLGGLALLRRRRR